VLEGPTWAALWSLPGLVLILALWGYTQVSRRLARSRARMDEVDRVAREVESLGDFRRVVADDEEPGADE
jgi:cytochrome c-type biogenesis protein CcmH/NrfF